MLFVLTAEPYHENSTVIGLFDNQTDAVAAFLSAPLQDTNDRPDSWMLEAWEVNGREGRRLQIHSDLRYHNDEGRNDAGKSVLWSEDMRSYEIVDPATFDFSPQR